MASKRCKIHYRRLRRENNQFPDGSLSSKIAAALSHQKDQKPLQDRVDDRLAAVPRNAEYQRLVNNVHVGDDHVFGDLCLFAPGQLQALLRLSGGEQPSLAEVMKAWDIAESKAPDGHEYLAGIAYWLAIGDHFYMVQHVSIQAAAAEEYLTWLLREASPIIGSGHHVELQAKFDREQVGEDLGDLTSIEVGGLVPETVYAGEEGGTERGDVATVEVEARSSVGSLMASTFAKARKILDDLVGEVEAQKIIDSVPPEAALDVQVNIGFRAKKRQFNREFMDNLASGLRNIPDGQIRIRGKNGEIQGDDARLSMDMSIRKMSETSGLLNMEHALEQMIEVHRRFLHDGKVQA